MNVQRGYFQQLVLGIVASPLCWETTPVLEINTGGKEKKKKTDFFSHGQSSHPLTFSKHGACFLCPAEIRIKRLARV